MFTNYEQVILGYRCHAFRLRGKPDRTRVFSFFSQMVVGICYANDAEHH